MTLWKVWVKGGRGLGCRQVGRGKVAHGPHAQQILPAWRLITLKAGEGTGNIGAKLSDKRDANGAGLSSLAGHQSPSHPPGKRVFPGNLSWCAAGHMAQTQSSCPLAPIIRLLDTEGVSSILREGAADPEGVGDGPGGMWGSGVESPGWEGCLSTQQLPVLCQAVLAILRTGVPTGDCTPWGTQQWPQTVWLL